MNYAVFFFLLFQTIPLDAYFDEYYAYHKLIEGDAQSAQKILEKKISATTSPSFENLYNAGKAAYSAGAFDNAAAYFKQAGEINSESNDMKICAWFDRGNALTKIKMYDDAIASYKNVLQLKPDHKEAIEMITQIKNLKKEAEQEKKEDRNKQKNDQNNEEKKDQEQKQQSDNSTPNNKEDSPDQNNDKNNQSNTAEKNDENKNTKNNNENNKQENSLEEQKNKKKTSEKNEAPPTQEQNTADKKLENNKETKENSLDKNKKETQPNKPEFKDAKTQAKSEQSTKKETTAQQEAWLNFVREQEAQGVEKLLQIALQEHSNDAQKNNW